MTDEKLCDERHSKLDSAVERIEIKLDMVIRHDEIINTFWKVIGIALSIAGLIIAGVKVFL